MNNDPTFSIGDVADATGISVYKLRMWENRYGAPYSVKLISGHRRFSTNEVERLKLVFQAVQNGDKVSKVVKLTQDELIHLLSQQTNTVKIYEDLFSVQLIAQIKNWDEKTLIESFEDEWSALGPIGFASNRAIPLLSSLGSAWERGDITVAHEHFASEILQTFLSSKWRQSNSLIYGRPFLLRSPSGESHCLGLHMVAAVTTAAKVPIIFLGAAVPEADLIAAIKENNPAGICLSFVNSISTKNKTSIIDMIDHNISRDIPIIIGGRGAPVGNSRCTSFSNLEIYYNWLKAKD